MRARLCQAGFAGLLAAMAMASPAEAQRDGPLPRFQDRLCPGIVGLQVDAAEMMVGRIRAQAQELGLRLSPEDSCEPNVVVAFVEDGRGYLNRLSRSQSSMFESLGARERRELLAHEGPVHVLPQIRTRTRDGMVVPQRQNLTDIPQAEMWMAHSRIYTPTRRDITSVLVLIDRDAIEGMNVSQLADYVAMRAFAVEHPERRGAAGGSILDLFNVAEAERPDGLTPTDIAFLSKLYEGLPNLPASARLAERNRAVTDNDVGAE